MGLTSAYGEWSRRDPVAAGERIASMPRSPQRDAAISGYTHSLAYRDPAAAIEWANSIAQDNLRTSALTRAGQALFRRDADAARQWLTSSGLPPEAQEQVLNPPRRREQRAEPATAQPAPGGRAPRPQPAVHERHPHADRPRCGGERVRARISARASAPPAADHGAAPSSAAHVHRSSSGRGLAAESARSPDTDSCRL
jgi:hypothetical protein